MKLTNLNYSTIGEGLKHTVFCRALDWLDRSAHLDVGGRQFRIWALVPSGIRSSCPHVASESISPSSSCLRVLPLRLVFEFIEKAFNVSPVLHSFGFCSHTQNVDEPRQSFNARETPSQCSSVVCKSGESLPRLSVRSLNLPLHD